MKIPGKATMTDQLHSGCGARRASTDCMRAALVGIAALMVIMVVVVAAGCGSSSTSSTTTPTASTSATTSATPTPASTTIDGATITEDPALNALLPSAVTSAGKVRVATDIPYPPFEMYTAPGSNQPTGFDYDLSQALGAKLGIPFEFDQIVFDSIIPSLQAGKADIVMAAMVDSATREKVLNFIDYAKVTTVLVIAKGNPAKVTSLQSLAGKAAAAQTGTIQAGMLQTLATQLKAAGKPALTVLTYPKDSDALLAIKSGKAVADLVQLPTGVADVTAQPNSFEIAKDPAAPNGYNPSTIGIGMVKANTQLLDAVSKALQALVTDGTYAKLLDKYGLGAAAVTTVDVNLGAGPK
jgi:polar amino acid transport system substrate-binding protein